MLKPQQATYVRTSETSGEISTDIKLGAAALTLRWPLGDAEKRVQESLNRLQVKLQRLEVSSGAQGSQLVLHLEVAGHAISSTLHPEGEEELQDAVDALLESVSAESAAHIQSLLDAQIGSEPNGQTENEALPAEEPYAPGVPVEVVGYAVVEGVSESVAPSQSSELDEEGHEALMAGLRALGG
jgi:hypothetical protein